MTIAELVAAAHAGDEALCAWIVDRLRPLATQPKSLRLTVHAGGGKITVKRDAPVYQGGRNETVAQR